jgi:O-antigen/teichoic acid export membrane protein
MRRLLVGNGAAQALQFGSIFVLSRLYAPADFGVLAQVQSLATLAAVLLTLQMHLAIPLAATRAEADALTAKVESLCLMGVVGLAGLAVWLGDVIYGLGAALALGVGLNNVYASALVRRGEFTGLSRTYLLRAGAILGMQLAFLWVPIAHPLAWATVAGELLAAMMARAIHLRGLRLVTSLRAAWQAVVEQRSFTLYGTLQEMVSVAAFLAPVLLFTLRFGDAVAGHFSMASRLVWAPVILVSGSIAQVLYHQYGKALPTSTSELLAGVRAPVMLGGLVLTCLTAFALRDTVAWLLGDAWGLAGHMLPWHVVWGAIFLVSTPFRVACRMYRLQKIQLMIDAGLLVAILWAFRFSSLAPMQLMVFLVVLALVQNATLVAMIHRAVRQRSR